MNDRIVFIIDGDDKKYRVIGATHWDVGSDGILHVKRDDAILASFPKWKCIYDSVVSVYSD